MNPVLTSLILGLSLSLGFPAWADSQHAGPVQTADHGAALSEGGVKNVARAQGKLTLRHGPLENLGMPGMTMVFRVREAGWLDRLKPGDNIRFLAERVNGVFTLTQFEVVKP